MNIRYATFFFAAACGCAASAQITLSDPDNVPMIGDTFTYSRAAYAAAPAGGADQLFDYSTLVSTGTSTFTWSDTSIYSHGGLFPAAEMTSVNGTDTVMYAVTSAGLERVGEFKHLVVFGQPVNLEIVHSNNMLELELPLAFNDTWNDPVVGTVYSDGSTGDRNGSIHGEAEGYGDLLLPGVAQPISVLRVFTNLQEIIQIPIGGNPSDVVHKRKQYDYYAPYLKMPILSVYSDSLSYQVINIVDNGIRWMSSNPVGIEETASAPLEVGLAPNPASDDVVVNLDAPAAAGATLFVSDATGRMVITQRLPVGTRHWDLDTQTLATGCYSVTVSDRDGSHGSARLVKR